jgi:hypothetical protein
VRRREFIALLGGAVAWPITALAQQHPMPVVGFLWSTSREDSARLSCFPSAVDQRPVSAVMGHSVRRMCIKSLDQSDYKHSLDLSMARNHEVRRKSKP